MSQARLSKFPDEILSTIMSLTLEEPSIDGVSRGLAALRATSRKMALIIDPLFVERLKQIRI